MTYTLVQHVQPSSRKFTINCVPSGGAENVQFSWFRDHEHPSETMSSRRVHIRGNFIGE